MMSCIQLTASLTLPQYSWRLRQFLTWVEMGRELILKMYTFFSSSLMPILTSPYKLLPRNSLGQKETVYPLIFFLMGLFLSRVLWFMIYIRLFLIPLQSIYYKYMSNIEPNPSKEIQSLAKNIDKSAMGQRLHKSKPKKPTKDAHTNKKPSQGSSIIFKGGDLFTEKFDETLYYRPKTLENKVKYENFLGRINRLVEDIPQDTLISMTDEVLAILKGSESEIEKKMNVQAILGDKIDQEQFLDLLNICQTITDYQLEEEGQGDEEIVLEDENEDEEGSGNEIVSEIDDDEEKEGAREGFKVKENREKREGDADELKKGKLNPSSIDAHWLHSQLSKFFDPLEAQNIQDEILSILSSETRLEAENGLLSVLNYDQYDFIKLLLENRMEIYYCTKYHQSQNEKEREQFIEEMKAKDITIFSAQGSKKKGQQVTLKKQTSAPEIEEEDRQLHIVELARDEEIHRINKKLIDLSLHDSTDNQNKVASKQEYKFKLPSGATKNEKPGYEEVFIPPAVNTKEHKLIEISDLPSWMAPAFYGIKRLNPIQSRVCDHTLQSNRNMLVCAPTSAGKTNIALMAILRVMSENMRDGVIDNSKFKIVYIAPMKALVAQITGNLSHRLKELNITVKELTGDMHLTKAQIEETQIIVSTPEKWDIVTRKAGDRLFTEQVRLLIIDEIHLLSDSRGPVLESLIARTIRQSEISGDHVRIVGLSATLPNYKDVGATLRVSNPSNGLFYFDSSYRPVPLEQLYCGVTEKKGVRKMMMVNEILYEKVMERVSKNQIIIFVHSRRDTARTARYLKDTAYAKNESYKILKPDSESKKILEGIIEETKNESDSKTNSRINSEDLRDILGHGIGIHHAGLSRSDRDLVEQLFADRHLNVLISTATLAWGVNLPAHTVIIKGTQVYSPEEGRWLELSMQDVMQMLGRAGRPRYDERGEGIIISGYEEIRYYLGLLNMSIPLESQMLKSLPDQLNAEIVLGTVTNIRDGVNWLGYTYLFIRMLKNPKYYSISLDEIEEDPELLRRRVNLVHTAATILERNGLLNYDRRSGAFSSTFLGKISSHFYVKYASMDIYSKNLKPNSGLIELFKIFSMSSEFKFLSVRDEEKNELQKLIDSVPVPIKGSVDDATSKISVLLQAHISRLHLDGYALNVDKVYVTQSASRIMRALFEICLKKGWGQVAQRCLQLAKMIDKSMWSCMNPLRQFKAIPEYVLSRLEKKQQFSWESFYQMTPQEIGDLTRFPKLGKILHKFVHHVPRVEINAYAQPITRSCLKVDLTIKCDFKWDQEIHGRDEPFWLMVLDCNEESLLFSYFFTLSKKQENFYIQFIVPLFEILHPLYYIKVVSDRWVCSDNLLPLSFKSMILPSRFPAPNEILDLQPIPAAHLSLSNFNIARDLKINYLNQIQTQVYQAFVNSDENVFLGAAEGSGKFTLGLISVAKCLEKRKKAVVIFPNKSIVSQKLMEFNKIFGPYKCKVSQTFSDLAKDTIVLQNMDIILTTPEAWDILTRRWKARKGFTDIGLILIDSLHLLPENYCTLEVVVSRMRYISSQIQQNQDRPPFKMIGLSASIADYVDVGEWLGAPSDNIFNFHPNIRENSVEIIFSSYDQTIRESRIHMMQKNIFHNLKHYNRNAIIFVSDKKQAQYSSLDFVSLISMDSSNSQHTGSQSYAKRFRKIPDDQMKFFATKITDLYLVQILEYGIGYIYEGMNEIEKEIVLKLFQTEGISILVVSQGLKWELTSSSVLGINKAFMVCVMDCEYFDPKKERWVDYSIPDMVQAMSLASISEKDKNKGKEYSSAKFIIMCHTPKKNYYKKFLFEPFPIESSLHLGMNLPNHLNSSISIKSIESKEQCIDWLTWTFMYRRLTQNPNYYNMQEVSEEGISTYLSELIENSVQYLQGVKCIEVEEENQMELTATNLGIICSYYYIKIETVGNFVEKVQETMRMEKILEMISQAEELSEFSGFRPNEHHTLGRILTQVVADRPVNKVHALLLIHLNRLHTKGDIKIPNQIMHEIRKVLPIAVKLCHALVDIISSFGFLKPLILTMQLSQMLVQALWVHDSKFLQVIEGPQAEDLAERIEKKLSKDISVRKEGTILNFLNMDDDERDLLLKGRSDVDKIANACNRYPSITVQAKIVREDDEEESDQINLEVSLTRDEPLENDEAAVICPYFPSSSKEEFWWVIVGDKSTNKVLTTKRAILKNAVSLSLSFEKMEGVSKYSIYTLCDSYVGCDQVQEIVISDE